MTKAMTKKQRGKFMHGELIGFRCYSFKCYFYNFFTRQSGDGYTVPRKRLKYANLSNIFLLLHETDIVMSSENDVRIIFLKIRILPLDMDILYPTVQPY